MPKPLLIDGNVLSRFHALKSADKLAHAYLLIGPKGIGKSETALAIAKLVNCEAPKQGRHCDGCSSCVKINAGNHPDISVINHEPGEAIKIEMIRELLSRNRLRAFMAQKKVFIINRIENLTQESANAFLKTLEEPAGDTLMLLTTSVIEKNLDTIRSRCQNIYFKPMDVEELREKLIEEEGIDRLSAHCVSFFAQGCYGSAADLVKDGFIDRKNVLVDDIILKRPDDDDMKELLSDKSLTKEFLNILSSWMRDAILVISNVHDGRLIHADRREDLRAFAGRFSFQELVRINSSVVNMHKMLADNLNIKLPLLIIGEQLWTK